ncbi:hypothetical protein GCM10008910_01430 [Faecalicatena orotica]|uniref:hypothetical protein n=1 Tax=Faecalicatena orotica TaxID=1544 RepID=UPI0011B2488E
MNGGRSVWGTVKFRSRGRKNGISKRRIKAFEIVNCLIEAIGEFASELNEFVTKKRSSYYLHT